MVAGGYRVEPDQLRAGGRWCHKLSDDVRAGVAEPLAPAAGANEGFASIPAAVETALAWEVEAEKLATALRVAGDKLAANAAEYERADAACADGFQRILGGG